MDSHVSPSTIDILGLKVAEIEGGLVEGRRRFPKIFGGPRPVTLEYSSEVEKYSG